MIRALFIIAAMLMLGNPGAAWAGPTKPEIYRDVSGRALKGYDAVAYHLERRPVRGSQDFAYEWKGAEWWFVSAENRDRFIADPDRWAPQYGGYCAWGIARDRVFSINPTIFRIVNDKLYLNLNMRVHREWLANRTAFIFDANEKWPEVLEFK